MSDFDTLFADARTELLSFHADTVTYEGNSISAILTDLGEEEIETSGKFDKVQTAEMEVSLADVADPKKSDQVTDADSKVWTVLEVLDENGGMATLKLALITNNRTSQPGLRAEKV